MRSKVVIALLTSAAKRRVLAAVVVGLLAAAASSATADSTGTLRRLRGDDEARIVVAEAQGDRWLLQVARKADGRPPVKLELVAADDASSAFASFLDRGDLVDVKVTRTRKQPVEHRETHYILRVRPTGDELVCRFEGRSMENDASRTTWVLAEVRKLSDAPLRFEVGYATRASTDGKTTMTNRYVRYVMPATGSCHAEARP